MDVPLKFEEKEILYKNFANSLKLLNMEGIEIIPQTMAPFPWHFGGQRYQNLFILGGEIVEFCKKFNIRIKKNNFKKTEKCNISNSIN